MILLLIIDLVSGYSSAWSNGVEKVILKGNAGESRIIQALTNKFPGTRVEFVSTTTDIDLASRYKLVELASTDSRGMARFLLSSPKHNKDQGSVEIKVRFKAMKRVPIALRRVSIGQKLLPEIFSFQEIDVASGQAAEYRGAILDEHIDLQTLETVHTVLEGSFLTTSGTRKIPDIRRGDAVRVRVVSGPLLLSTSAEALETGYLDDQIKVLTKDTKREMVGQLKPDKIIEVKL